MIDGATWSASSVSPTSAKHFKAEMYEHIWWRVKAITPSLSLIAHGYGYEYVRSTCVRV